MEILRINEVRKISGLSRTTIWRLERHPESEFPKRVLLSKNSVGWFKDEIEEWLANRPRAQLKEADDVS